MPKETTSKVQNKIQAKAAAKMKRHGATAPVPEEGSKSFPILSSILKDKRSIIPIEELNKLDFQSKVKLIEEVSEYVLTAPESHIIHIQTLLHLGEDDNLIIAKMGLLSATEVFKDIAPLYEINEDTLKEEVKKQISKDDRKLLMFELSYIQAYRRFVDMLSDLLQLKPKKYVQTLGAKDLPEEERGRYEDVCREYNRIALLCLSNLITSLFHLNFRRDIANLVASKLKSFDEESRKISVRTVSQFFADRNPAAFEVKSLFVLSLSKQFGSTSEGKLPDDFLDIMNNLDLQMNQIIIEEEVDKTQIGKNHADQKKKLKHLDKEIIYEAKRKEKRLRKELKEELKEAEATINPKKLESFKTDILLKVFYIYFKILKCQKPSKFFGIAINGVLKFIHLISVDILSDLIQNLGECGDRLRLYHLKNIAESKDLLHARVRCIFASVEIVSELGKTVELDDKESILTLYHLFIDLCKHPKTAKQLTKTDQELIIKTVQKLFINKRQLSLETTASFLKIFLTFAIRFDLELTAFIKTIMFVVKLMLQKYTTLTRLLEEDNQGYGFDLYNPNIEDPQATNALRTYIVDELHQIQKRFTKNTEIQTLVKKIESMERLPTHLASLNPSEFFRRYTGQ